jgi:hypothetical protein
MFCQVLGIGSGRSVLGRIDWKMRDPKTGRVELLGVCR